MSKSLGRSLLTCGALAACLIAAAPAPAAAPQDPGLSLDQLARMGWPELERLYRQSDAGPKPEGFAAGKAIYCPCGRLAAARSRLTGVVWRGKVFDGADGTLVNQWCGFRAIRARVYYGPSQLDGARSILMDYSETSWVWADVRDEVREVAPGLYLGRMYRCKAGTLEFQMFFVLQACPG